MSGQTKEELVAIGNQLHRISRDLREAGDVELVILSEDGVSKSVLTLADEIWTIAVTLSGSLGAKP